MISGNGGKIMKTLLTFDFEFVEKIEPNRSRDGSIQEYHPELAYIKKENAVLNKHGDGPFCRFSIHPKWCVSGVYALYIASDLVYIGQALDFAKRWNTGYGNIAPRACWSNGASSGQSTNCKINKIILNACKENKAVELYFHKTADYHTVEKSLIEYFHPIHNVSLNSDALKRATNKVVSTKVPREKAKQIAQDTPSDTVKIGTQDIKDYLENLFTTEIQRGSKQIILVSGDVHKRLDLTSKMPSVCTAMYSVIRAGDTVLKTTPSGKSTTITILYSLVDR